MNEDHYREELFKKYRLNTELYQFYISLAVTVNLGYYAITSAILAYYFLHIDHPSSHYALIFPFIMALALLLVFRLAVSSFHQTQDDLEEAAQLLNYDMFVRIDALRYVCTGSAVLFFLLASGLLILIISH